MRIALLTARFATITLVAATLGAAPTFNPPDPSVVFTDITAATGITFSHVYASEKKYIVESMSGGAGFSILTKMGGSTSTSSTADGGHGGEHRRRP
jgi:hypothetical protein